MKRTLSILCILALMLSGAVLFTGCSDESVAEYPVTVGDVTIEEEPKSVVVLDDSFADILAYMGYDRKLVGRSDVCDQKFLNVFPSVGSAADPSVAAVIEKGATLVIANSELSDAARSELQTNGVIVVKLNPATDLKTLKELYATLAAILGGNVTGREKGEKAYNTLIDKLGQYKTLPAGVVKTSVYLYLDDQGQLCTFTKGSLEQLIFGYNGTINALSNQESAPVVASELRMGSPSYIFYDDERVLDYLRSDDTLCNLAALKNGRTCRIALKDFYRHGLTCEQIIYDMVSFIDESESASTSDEPTPDELADQAADNDGETDDGYSDEYSDDDYYDDYSDDDYYDDYSDDDD